MSLPATISLSGRTAIVTGGSRGIGKEISIELARRGASVAIVYANPAKTTAAQETVDEIKAIGVDAVAILADLKDVSSSERIVKETLAGLGSAKIDILGVYSPPPLSLFCFTRKEVCVFI
jgi:3-oxoacyl-[acyl-carrier protein] reductase